MFSILPPHLPDPIAPRMRLVYFRWLIVFFIALGSLSNNDLIAAPKPKLTLKIESAHHLLQSHSSRSSPRRFREGDVLKFSATSSVNGHLSLFLKNSGGEVYRIFPREGEMEKGRLSAGKTLVWPEEGADYQLEVEAPFGTRELIGLVTEKPISDSTLPTNASEILVQGKLDYYTYAGPPSFMIPSLDQQEDRFALSLPLVVYFKPRSSQISGSSNLARLQLIAEALQESSLARMHLRIEGHSDSLGNTLMNMKLGKTRATAVAQALEHLGISRERMIVDSRGDYEPAVEGDAPENTAFNRRVELRIIDPSGPRTPVK